MSDVEEDKPALKSEESGKKVSKIECTLRMVSHFVCVLFTCFVVYTAWPGSSLFSWHPTLMSVAFGLLMAEALLMFSPQSSLALNSSRNVKVQRHWVLHTSAFIVGSLGLTAIVYNKVLHGKAHFQSWHAKIGLATFCYFALQCVVGSTLLYPNFMKSIRLADKKLYHATSGTLLFVLVNLSLILGMCSSWYTRQVTGTAWYASIFCPLILCFIVTLQVTNAYVKRNQQSGPTTK